MASKPNNVRDDVMNGIAVHAYIRLVNPWAGWSRNHRRNARSFWIWSTSFPVQQRWLTTNGSHPFWRYVQMYRHALSWSQKHIPHTNVFNSITLNQRVPPMKFAAVRLKKKKDGKFFNKEERRSYKISRASYPVQLRGCNSMCQLRA